MAAPKPLNNWRLDDGGCDESGAVTGVFLSQVHEAIGQRAGAACADRSFSMALLIAPTRAACTAKLLRLSQLWRVKLASCATASSDRRQPNAGHAEPDGATRVAGNLLPSRIRANHRAWVASQHGGIAGDARKHLQA